MRVLFSDIWIFKVMFRVEFKVWTALPRAIAQFVDRIVGFQFCKILYNYFFWRVDIFNVIYIVEVNIWAAFPQALTKFVDSDIDFNVRICKIWIFFGMNEFL